MAKVPFSKLQATVNGSDCKTFYYNKDGEEVYYEVKQYLPLKDKIELVQRVVNQSVDDNGFYNPMRVKLFMVLEIVYAYTNLSFTEKMKEDPFKLYDLVFSTGIFADIIKCAGEHEYEIIKEDIFTTIDNIYKYRNSIAGIIDSISTEYNNLDLDAENIKSKLADPNNMELVKSIIINLV